MLLKPDQQRVRDLLSETITLLCKNSLYFKTEFTVEALIGITLDKSEVLLMNINETITLPGELGVDKDHVDLSDKQSNVNQKKSGRNSDNEVSGDLKRGRNNSNIFTTIPVSNTLPSHTRSSVTQFTDTNVSRDLPVSTQYADLSPPVRSNTLYMPYDSTHKTSSSLKVSKKRRRLEMPTNSVSSPIAETLSVLTDQPLPRLSGRANSSKEPNPVKEEPHDGEYSTMDDTFEDKEQRAEGASSSSLRHRSFTARDSDDVDQNHSHHKQEQSHDNFAERGPHHADRSSMFSDGHNGRGGPPPGFTLPYPMPYDCRIPPLGDMMQHRAMSSDMSSAISYGLNFMPIPPHLYFDDDRLLPTSPMNLQMKLGGDEGEKTARNKVLPKEAVNEMVEWLREHQDNPYPNDEEKETLAVSTKLSLSQINYWFTNARRRILPKWVAQRGMEQERALHASHSPSS